MAMRRGKCKSCGAPIFFVETANGKFMPVNITPKYYWPDPEGPEKIVNGSGRVVSCFLDGKLEQNTPAGYVSHFATCPAASKHRKKKPQKAEHQQLTFGQ